MTLERWLPITGWEGAYEVSDMGRVRSLDRFSQQQKANGQIVPFRVRGSILKPSRSKGGYLIVNLRGFRHRETRSLHTLVAETFIGPCPEGQEVCHENDIKTDNRATNLSYGTRSKNLDDAVRNGRHHWASRDECSRGHKYINENTRIQIRHGRERRVCRACKRINDGKRRQANAA